MIGNLYLLLYSKLGSEVQPRPDRQAQTVWLTLHLNASDLSANLGGSMLYWALVFLIVAIIAAIFGFGGIAVAAAGIAKLLFFIFLVIFVITLITGLTRRGRTGI